MASSKQSIGLQISFGLAMLLMVIGWGLFYMQLRELNDNKAVYAKAQEDLRLEQSVSKGLDEDIQKLAQISGYPQPEVGDAGQANTKMGAIQSDLAKATADHNLPTQTLAAAVEYLSQRIKDLQSEVGTKDAAVTQANTTIAGLSRTYQTRVDAAEAARQKAERDNQDLVRSKDEEVRAKQLQIQELSRNLADLDAQFTEARNAWDEERKNMNDDLTQYREQVDLLRQKLKDVTAVSFERPDGLIRWVDNSAGLVWINLGSQDGLRLRTTFAVYRKTNFGVGLGRGAEDIKGQLEVIRIIDNRTAECRILADDLYDPIAKGDPIYTPLWSPGRTEKFAVVGLIDLDDDGVYDREQFHNLVMDAGASVVHEVLDDGSRIYYQQFPSEWLDWTENSPEMDSDTKYLIKAEIPDPVLAISEDDKKIRSAISANLDAMRDEARRLGVEEINLNDFLAYVGYRPQQRLFIPGVVDRPFNLKNGAASVTTNELATDREAAGKVSDLYGRSKRLKPMTSSGQVSPLYQKSK